MTPSTARRARRAADGDDGFSLVEVLVAMFVIMVVMMALLAALGASVKSVRASAERSDAAALGSQQLEALQAVDFTDQLGFYSADPDFRASHAGRSTKVLTGTRATACPTGVLGAADAMPVPACPLVRRLVEGTVYTIRTDITVTDGVTASPAPTPSPSSAPAYYYAQLRTEIGWSTPAGPRTLVLDAFRAPTPEELDPDLASPVLTPSPTASASPSATGGPTSGVLDLDPASILLTSGGTTTEEVVAELTTATAPDSVTGSWTNNSTTTTLAWTPNGTRTVWTARIPLGTSMQSGAVDVSARASFAGTPVDFTAAATASTTVTPAVDILTPTVTPALCRRSHSNLDQRELVRSSVVDVEILGVTSADAVTFGWTNPNVTNRSGGYVRQGANGGAVFRTTIPAGTEFHGTSTTITVAALRPADPQPASEGFLFPVLIEDGGTCA